jgi:hypothetical protein
LGVADAMSADVVDAYADAVADMVARGLVE